jgi:cytochrome oxidase Cu insertion factor (SCO1/SenC/PrrC family)
MRSVSALLAVTCLAAGLLSPPRAAAKEVGLAVGEVAPKLSLVDQRGATHSLETLLGHGTLAIVFFRSADW